ncbi:MAG: hypothetical protein ACKV2T_19395 [Kofleriaceae bacterium]
MDPDRPIVRWSLVVLWLLVALMLYEPAVALFGWPLLLLAFAGGVVWTAQDFAALRHQTEPIRIGTVALAIELVVLAASTGACVVVAGMTSIVDAGRDYALSEGFVPLLMAIVLVATLRTLRNPTPRRIAVVSLVALGVVPILATIQILHVTTFGFGELRVLSPMAITAYSVCTLAIGAIGIHLGIVARRHGYGDDIPAAPPKARLQP